MRSAKGVESAKSKKSAESKKSEDTRAFLKRATDDFKLAEDANHESRVESLDDFRFAVLGEQWPQQLKQQRSMDGKPSLTINRMPGFIKQVTNEQRQQRPAIQINPIGDGADTDTAEILQGIVRHIEVNSDAEIAYDNAFEHMVTGGFGFIRRNTVYVDDDSDDQEITIEWVKNPFCILLDPGASKPDKSDARFAFVFQDMRKADYDAAYPDSAAASMDDFSATGNQPEGWLAQDSVRVAEYFYVEEEPRTVLTLEDGAAIEQEAFAKAYPSAKSAPRVLRKRRTMTRKVKWAKINAIEILEERDWPGKYISIWEVVGDEQVIDGKLHKAGLVRNAKDPQRAYNYQVSAATQAVALMPSAPWVGAKGQFKDRRWATANTSNWAYLEYDPIDIKGAPVGPPQRNTAEPAIQGVLELVRQADNDIKAATGIYDASLGQKGPDESGKAILARQKQTDVTTLNYSDNLARTIRALGRDIVSVIPEIYDVPRIQRIIRPDSSVDHVAIYNSKTYDQGPQEALALVNAQRAQLGQDPLKKIYDIGVGRYDVAVTVGPSYQSKRQEAVASMLAFIQAVPSAAPLIADLVASNMDWHAAKEIAARLKKMLPPQLQNGDDSDPEVQLQRLQATAQQMFQQHQQLTAALNNAMEMLRSKQVEAQSRERIAAGQNQSRERIALIQRGTTLGNAEIQTKAQLELGRREADKELFDSLHDAAHETALEAMGAANAQQQQAFDAANQPTEAAPTQ